MPLLHNHPCMHVCAKFCVFGRGDVDVFAEQDEAGGVGAGCTCACVCPPPWRSAPGRRAFLRELHRHAHTSVAGLNDGNVHIAETDVGDDW